MLPCRLAMCMEQGGSIDSITPSTLASPRIFFAVYTYLRVFPCRLVSSLRKAEKAAAIKVKREEVEALRRALAQSPQQRKPILAAPISDGMFGLTGGATEAPQAGEVSDLSSGPPSFSRSAQSYRQQEPPRTIVDRSSSLVETSDTCDGDVEQISPEGNYDTKRLTMATATRLFEPPAPHVGLTDQQSQGDHRKICDSRNCSDELSQLRPPVVDVSPPLSVRTPENKEGRRRWSEEESEPTRTVGKGELVAVRTSKGRAHALHVQGREHSARLEPAEQVSGHTDPEVAVVFDNPLHR